MDDATAIPAEQSAERPVASSTSRWRELPFLVLVGVLVVAVVATGSIWWVTHRGPDLSIGSKHRVTVGVREVGPQDCQNNLSNVTVGGQVWWSDEHAPDGWAAGPVTGTFKITAAPAVIGATALFTADQGGVVAYTGPYPERGFTPGDCVVS